MDILQGDCRHVLKTLPDQSVHCCVTSPPYFGLRDYGHAGQIGLEATPDTYVAELVAVFSEVRRVLRDDGTLFLNLGDSYFGAGYSNNKNTGGATRQQGGKQKHTTANVRRGGACDISGKAPVNSQANDCLCENLCDACRRAYRIGKSHNGGLRVPMPMPSPSATSRERKELQNAHFPTSDLANLASHSGAASAVAGHLPDLAAGPLRASDVSTPSESSLQRPANSRQLAQPLQCQLCGCSLPDFAQASAHKEACICDTKGGASEGHRNGMGVSGSAYPHYTTASLKPKDLIGIPWRVAFALQANGWYLRQDIIWSKPNPMPESVKDRCTKSHEYIFLLSKSPKYYYDAAAIAEDCVTGNMRRPYGSPGANSLDPRGKQGGGELRKGADKQRGHGRRHAGFNDRWDAMPKEEQGSGKRNKRDVWAVATRPYKGAHFATFPPKLIEPCILAGCPIGGVVLDPFGGAGTTGLVATGNGRNAILIELNAAYGAMAGARIARESPPLKLPEYLT